MYGSHGAAKIALTNATGTMAHRQPVKLIRSAGGEAAAIAVKADLGDNPRMSLARYMALRIPQVRRLFEDRNALLLQLCCREMNLTRHYRILWQIRAARYSTTMPRSTLWRSSTATQQRI